MSDIQLNAEQLLAFEGIKQWLDGSFGLEMLLSGYPGTGKTFTLSYALEQLKIPESQLAIAAPSHKAKRVISEYITGLGLNYSVFTVHSLLGLGVEIDEKGKQSFDKQNSKAPINQFRYIWVDECSMINTELVSKLRCAPVSIIWTGDENQLLPVGEKSFPVFDAVRDNGIPWYKLTNPERYSGAIKDYVYDALDCVQKERLFEPEKYIQYEPNCTFQKDWFNHWKDNENDKVVLTMTNDHVDSINEKCRGHVYGYDAPDFIEGEVLLSYAPITDPDGEPMIPNGTEVSIKSIEPCRIIGQNCGFDAYSLGLKGYYYPCQIIAKHEKKRWEQYLESIKKRCKAKELRWGDYYYAVSLSAQLKPIYGLTIHKSQGSGYQDVYFVNSFKWLKDKQLQPRLHYVGASRAKENLWISGRV